MTRSTFVLSLFVLGAAGGCSGPREAMNPESIEPRPPLFSRTFNLVRGSPARIEQAGRRHSDRIQLDLVVKPEEIRVSQTRRIEVAVTLSNPSPRALSLQFPTTQRIEILIQDESGRVVERWSEDRMFAQSMGHVAINPGERVEYRETISTRDLRPGTPYVLAIEIPGYPELTARWRFTPSR